MRRLPVLIALLLAPAVARAQSDPEADKPYELQVVLRCGAHNWLGKPFRDDLRGGLAGMLADALGPMADVKVIDLKETPPDQWPPLWRDVDGRGFVALDSPRELNGVKTHFVRIEFVGGQYEVQARQLDGLTGLAGPLRRERTADRAFVARTAGKLIAEDFGVIGTIAGRGGPEGDGEVMVNVRFKAFAPGVRLERWVKPGDVFALARVAPARGGGKEQAAPEPYALVQLTAEPKDGSATARLIYRDRNPLAAAAGGLVLRCIRLGAASGPLRLRLVDDKGRPHTRTLQVRVHSQAFQKGLAPDEEILNPDRNGLFVSRRNYDQLAFARVVTGGAEIARFPVPIRAEGEVVAVVGLDAEKERFGQLQALRAELQRNYTEAVLRQMESYKEVKGLITQSKYEEALRRAKSVRGGLESDLEQLHAKKEEVKAQLAGSSISVASCDKDEKDLETYKTSINRLIGQLEETARLENMPDKVEKRVKIQKMLTDFQARFDSDDIDGAIAVLRKILDEYPDEPAIKKRLDDLEAQWALKGADHREARDFVYREWPSAKSAADLETKLPVARQKLQVLARVGDQLTLLKLNNSLPEKHKVLRDEIQSAVQNSPDDAEKLARLKKTGEEFDKFAQEVNAALTGKDR